jgi:hypothetical protein
MDALGRWLTAFGHWFSLNAVAIGIVGLVVALGAAFLKLGIPAAAAGAISGIAFMWLGRNQHPPPPEEEEV